MKTLSTPLRLSLPFVALSLIWFSLYKLSKSTYFETDSGTLQNALAFDLFVFAPVLYYFLIRNTKIPILTVIPVFLLSTYIAQVALKSNHQGTLTGILDYRFYIAETLFVLLETFMVIGLIKAYQKVKKGPAYFVSDMKNACNTYFGRNLLAKVMASEITLFFILFKRSVAQPFIHFNYHGNRKSYFILFFIVILIETVGLHFLITRWSALAAWIATFGSAYILMFLWSHYKASKMFPIFIDKNSLVLNNGLLFSTSIPLDQIEKIETTRSLKNVKNRQVIYINSMGDMGGFNTTIHLKSLHFTTGLYGKKLSFNTIALDLDDKDYFMEKINKTMYTIVEPL